MCHRYASKGRLLGGALALAGILSVPSAYAESGTGTATATVITPIEIGDSTTDLAFGNISAGAGGAGTVTVTAAGVRTAGGFAGLAGGLAVTAASFAVTGVASTAYTVTLPADSVHVLSGTGPNMDLTAFTSSTLSTGAGTAGTTDGTGDDTVSIGATLNLADKATQTVGAYTGTFNIVVEYD